MATSAFNAGAAAVESARATAAPYVQSATDTVARALSGLEAQATPKDPVPSKTAPLESGQQVVDTPYPQATTTQSTKVGGL